jgi:hypothetical protein
MHATIQPGCSAWSAYRLDGRRVLSPVVRMTEPTARELVDLNVLPSPNKRLDARANRRGRDVTLGNITRCG